MKAPWQKERLAGIVDGLPGPFPVLGTGVWGTVLELGDGTVLKLGRKKGGIGDGLEKAKRESAVLTALAARRQYFRGLAFPGAVAGGEIPANDALFNEGYVYWKRLTKMSVPTMNGERFKNMSSQQKLIFAESLAEAMYEFHSVFKNHPMESDQGRFHKTESLLELKSYTLRDSDRRAADFLITAFDEARFKNQLVFGHGDLNFGNVTVDESGRVAGFIDFAETAWTFPEAELCHFLNEADFTDLVVKRYEAISGEKLSPGLLELCAANNALFGAVICEYCTGEQDEARECRSWLGRHLDNLGFRNE